MAEPSTTPAVAGSVALPAAPPLVRTKLHRPALMPDNLYRPRLTGKLDEALRRRLVLLAAPAGYGKTTLLTQWLSAHEGRTDTGAETVAWLTLEEADNEPRRFLSYLVAALPALDEQSRARAAAALRDLAPPSSEMVLADLLNDLAELQHDTVIVLDDYHLIAAPAIHRILTFIVEHLPPRAHLVVATRMDPPLPLARLRARGQLAELRAADLAFTPEETAAFLLETMELPLARDQLVALAERTEGWPAGLHLAAIALRDRPDQSAFVDSLVGTHRYIVDYLLEDVFARLPAHIQTFLLQTSILSRLCGPLCDAVLGVSPVAERQQAEEGAGRTAALAGEQSYSRLILDALERDNLFLVPLDGERVWYRYHHLFAETLRERLHSGAPPEQMITLHRRASAWYAAHSMLTDAVGHALRAGAVDDVVAIIEPIGLAMATRVGEATLRAWMPGIPEATLRAHPRLALLRSWLAIADYEPDEAETWLRVAEDALARVAAGEAATMGNVANLRGEIAAVRARLATHAGDADQVIACAAQAMAWLQPENLALRTRVAKDLGYAYMVRGDYAQAERAFADAMASGLSAGSPYVMFMATSDYVYVRALRGGLSDAVGACRRAVTEAAVYGELNGPGSGLGFLALADIAGARREFAAALPALAEAGGRISPNNTTSYLCLMIVEARVARAQGDTAAALAHLRRARFVAQQRHLVWASAVLDSLEAQILIAAGDLSAASLLVDRAANSQEQGPAEFRYFPPAVLFAVEHCAAAPLQLRLARALDSQPELHELLGELEKLICAADQEGFTWRQIKLRLLQALAFAGVEQEQRAIAVLRQAVAIGAPEGYSSVYVEEGPALAALLSRLVATEGDAATRARAEELLGHFGVAAEEPAPPPSIAPPAPAPAALPEPLSVRELEVLRLMADGRSNTEIAAELVIAVSTVKSHVNNIFGKLGVATRTQAIARARRLSLI